MNWSELSETTAAMLQAQLTDPAGDAPVHENSAELIGRLLESLSPEEGMLITLLHLEERTVDEVRAQTGWTPVLIRVRAFRARRQMLEALEKLDSTKP